MIKNKDKDNGQETYTIPSDIMVEIAEVILQAKLPHEIIGVKENQGQIMITINYNMDLDFHYEASKNITTLLKDYNEMCSEESESINWRES